MVIRENSVRKKTGRLGELKEVGEYVDTHKPRGPMDDRIHNIHDMDLSDLSLETDGGVCESLTGIQADHSSTYFSASTSGGIPLLVQDPPTVDSQSSNDQTLESAQADECSILCFASPESAQADRCSASCFTPPESAQADQCLASSNAIPEQNAHVTEIPKEGEDPHQSLIPTVANQASFWTSCGISDPNIQKMLQEDEDGDTQLHMAIIQDLVPVAIYIIRCLSAVNADLQNNNLQTPLCLAVHTQHLDVVETLIECGASLSVVDKNGNTPLHIACIYGFYATVPSLLENVERGIVKKCISIPNYAGQSCIHLAADRMHFSVMRLLLSHGADVNEREKLFGMTILHNAVKTGNKQLLKYILHLQGLDLNSEMNDGYTPLSLAYVENQPDIVGMLRQVGCTL